MGNDSSLNTVSFTKSNNSATDLVCDVLVVGAGPSGIAAALELQSTGQTVVVIDKAFFPRDKCCGDGLTTGALRILDELGFNPQTVPNWTVCSDVWLRSPSGSEMQFSLPTRGQFAAIAPRIELDNALVQLARSKDIRVLEGHEFVSISEQTSDHITIDISNSHSNNKIETVQSKFVIASDGMWSPVRKSLGMSTPGYLGEWHAFRQYANNVTGSAKDRLHVWFEKDLLPGYAWSFPLQDGRVNIGFGILRGGKYSVQQMKDLWPDLLARKHIANALGSEVVMEDRHTAWPIPARVTSAPLSSGRVLFIGDAACVTDSLTGEGIGQALLSGQLSAQAIVAGIGREASITRNKYEQLIRQHFFADHRMSMTLGSVLKSSLGARAALRIANLTPWTRRNFVRWMFEDEPRAAIFTPSRWHRNFLRRDGAYVTQDQTK
jgi:geranylgeranyl reductase family protein